MKKFPTVQKNKHRDKKRIRKSNTLILSSGNPAIKPHPANQIKTRQKKTKQT